MSSKIGWASLVTVLFVLAACPPADHHDSSVGDAGQTPKLVVTSQPTVGLVGEPLVGIVVAAQDSSGSEIALPEGVSVVLDVAPQGAVLSGRTNLPATAGQTKVTFNDLSIQIVGDAKLRFTSGVLSVTSATISISSGGASATVGAAGAQIQDPFGGQIVIPAGAVASDVQLGIAQSQTGAPAFPPPQAEISAAGPMYELTPHGATFSVPVTIRIPFDPNAVPPDGTPVLYKAEQGGAFALIPSTVEGTSIVASVSSFSWVIPAVERQKPRRVYALTDKGLTEFRIDAKTGKLSGPASSALVGESPISVLVHPSGRFAYVTHNGATTVNGIQPYSVAVYGLDRNGAITGLTSVKEMKAQVNPVSGAFHPSGRFLYVVNYTTYGGNNMDVSLYTIDPVTGALSGPTSVADGGGAPPTGIAFEPSGKYAYVTYQWSPGTPVGNTFYQHVVGFPVDAETGALGAPVGSAPTDAQPRSIAADPTGAFVYVGNMSSSSGKDGVQKFAIGPNGAPTSKESASASNAASVAVDTRARFLLVGKQDGMDGYNLMGFQLGATFTAKGFISGLPAGQVAVALDPMGEFGYAIIGRPADMKAELLSLTTSSTGALARTGSQAIIRLPDVNGVGFPFSFAVTGPSLLWRPDCTIGCGSVVVISGGSSGSTGTTTSVPTEAPSQHVLTVTKGAWGAWIRSDANLPDGSGKAIDFGHWVPGSPSRNSAILATGTTVTLTATHDPNDFHAFKPVWTGDCDGSSYSVTVTMDRDRSCLLELQPFP